MTNALPCLVDCLFDLRQIQSVLCPFAPYLCLSLSLFCPVLWCRSVTLGGGRTANYFIAVQNAITLKPMAVLLGAVYSWLEVDPCLPLTLMEGSASAGLSVKWIQNREHQTSWINLDLTYNGSVFNFTSEWLHVRSDNVSIVTAS